MSVRPAAFSYVRFSSRAQAEGDSLRRQTEATRAWCDQHDVRLDEALTFRDLGKSAYVGEHRKNPDRHALAAFLKLVEGGKVPRGSYLVIESLDRLTREHVRAGLMLLLGLIEAGVRIVQLSPTELIYDESSDEMGLMLAIVELSRGHRESKRKSDLVRGAWVGKRNGARKGEVMTHHLPAWVEEQGGKLVLIPAKAAAVRDVFALAVAGYGLSRIVRKLNEDQVSALTPAGKWERSYVHNILTDGRVTGVYQPRRRDGQADGDPVPDYYPAVVSRQEWDAARAVLAGRRRKGGRLGDHVCLFSGLIKNARAGDTYYTSTRNTDGKRYRVLVNLNSHGGRGPCYAFPEAAFEAAVLSLFREIDPHDLLNGDGGPDESFVLAAELARVEGRLAELERELLRGDSATLAKVVRKLEDEKRDLAARLAEARQKAAHPLSETWGECQSLAETLAAAPDPADARTRLRSALLRIVDQMWLLVVPRGRDRLAAFQVFFRTDQDGKTRRRDYLIHYHCAWRSRNGHGDSRWWAQSLADVVATGKDLDLRRRDHARQLETSLLALPADALESGQ